MTDNSSQFTDRTYKLLRGLRRSIPDVPELASSPPVPKQKRRVKLVAIYGQPIIAHCINQGEFLYPKVVGHKIIQLDDDDETMSTNTTDDDTRKPHGTYGHFTVEDYQFLKNNEAYQRIRIKLSTSALEIRHWRIGGTTSAKCLLPSPASRTWAGYIEATLSVHMHMHATNDRKFDANNTMEAQSSSDAALVIVPQARMAEPAAAKLDAYNTMEAQSSSDAVLVIVPQARMAEPAAATDTGLSQYKDRIYRFIRGLRLTLPETAYRVNQVERQKGLKNTTAIDLTAMANHVKGDQFVHWMAVGQLLAWLVGNDQRRRMEAMSSMPTRDASVTEIGGLCSNQSVDVYRKLNRKRDTRKLKRENDTCSSTTGDAGHVDIKLTRDKESIGHHTKPAKNQGVIEETTQAAHGGHGDSVKDSHDEYEENAAPSDHSDDDEEEKIIRVDHLWSSDDDEEQNSKSVSAFVEHGCHTPAAVDEQSSKSISAMADHGCHTAARVEEDDDSMCIQATAEHGCHTTARVEEDDDSMCIQATAEHGCHTAARVEEDDDSWCGVLGLYACGQAGVFF